jgi:hypothetical protein
VENPEKQNVPAVSPESEAWLMAQLQPRYPVGSRVKAALRISEPDCGVRIRKGTAGTVKSATFDPDGLEWVLEVEWEGLRYEVDWLDGSTTVFTSYVALEDQLEGF